MGDFGEPTKRKRTSQEGRGYAGNAGRPTRFSPQGGRVWGECDPAKLQSAIHAVSSVGGALLLGSTRDGTASTLTLFYDEEKARFYPGSVEAAEIMLDHLVDWAHQAERTIDEFYR